MRAARKGKKLAEQLGSNRVSFPAQSADKDIGVFRYIIPPKRRAADGHATEARVFIFSISSLPKMPLPGLCIDDDLLAVGRWADDKASNQLSTMQPQQKERARHHLYTSTEPHRGETRSHRTKDARSSRQNYHNQPSRSEGGLLERPPQIVIKEVREAQRIRRGHPACFVKAEGGERGNEATAKPSESRSPGKQRLFKQASAVYLLLDGHEGMQSLNPVLNEEKAF
jgi:hypothetical protein